VVLEGKGKCTQIQNIIYILYPYSNYTTPNTNFNLGTFHPLKKNSKSQGMNNLLSKNKIKKD
jgi:hypothetical protein